MGHAEDANCCQGQACVNDLKMAALSLMYILRGGTEVVSSDVGNYTPERT